MLSDSEREIELNYFETLVIFGVAMWLTDGFCFQADNRNLIVFDELIPTEENCII